MNNTSTFSSPVAQPFGTSATKKSSTFGHSYFTQFTRTLAPLLLVDVIACLGSTILGIACAGVISAQPTTLLNPQLLAATVGGLVGIFFLLGLYSGAGMNPIYEFRQCIMGISVCFIFVASQRLNSGNAMGILLSFPLMLASISVARSITRGMLSKSTWWGVNCLIYGADRRVNQLFPMHIKNIPNGFRPVGFVQDELPPETDQETESWWVGRVDQTIQLMNRHHVHTALVHRRGRTDSELAAFHEKHLRDFAQVVIVSDDERIPALWSMGKDGGIIIEDRLLIPSSQFIKRLMDVAISGSVLVLGLPMFAMIAVWLKISSPGPLFFGHERIGRHGRRFKVWKFRSMCVNADAVLEKALAENPALSAEWEATQKLQNDPRVSSAGQFLRKTSLDELPQLWNVLKGEMSLVGPRPIVTNEVEKYEEKYKSYTRVTPGVTGFWQISGRNLTTYERRVELDDYYVRNWSVWFDLYILFRTVKTVLMREGAF